MLEEEKVEIYTQKDLQAVVRRLSHGQPLADGPFKGWVRVDVPELKAKGVEAVLVKNEDEAQRVCRTAPARFFEDNPHLDTTLSKYLSRYKLQDIVVEHSRYRIEHHTNYG